MNNSRPRSKISPINQDDSATTQVQPFPIIVLREGILTYRSAKSKLLARMPPIAKYWDAPLYNNALAAVTAPGSLESRVDQLWQIILTELFPTTQGYLVVCRAPLDNTHLVADVLLRRPGNEDKIYFTMSNKRAQLVGNENSWRAAKKQLRAYLKTEYQIGTAGDMGVQYGAVAIGTRVRFYHWFRDGGQQLKIFGVELDLVNDRETVQQRLRHIKAQIQGW